VTESWSLVKSDKICINILTSIRENYSVKAIFIL
jgi:hypothetical protein